MAVSELSKEARDYFLETRGLSLRSLDELRAILAYDAIASRAISVRIFDADLARERFGRSHAMLHAKLFISDAGALAGSANFSVGGLRRNLEYVDDLQAFPDLAATRREAAEDFWTLGADWTEQALEILRALLRPVSTEEAVARTVREMTSFAPWRVGGEGAAGRPPFTERTRRAYFGIIILRRSIWPKTVLIRPASRCQPIAAATVKCATDTIPV